MAIIHDQQNLIISVVIPCFNEEESLNELYNRVWKACASSVGDSYEIVLINDGSTDNTFKIMSDLAFHDHKIVAINLARNYGHQIALTAGLNVASGSRILILDADLQDPPELLDDMQKLMDRGADVVYGKRIEREGESTFKRSSAFIFYRLLNKLVDVDIPNDTGDFRLISRRALDVLNSMPEQHRFVRGMVSWIGLKQVPILYKRSERVAGESKYPFSRMMKLALDALTGFSIKPLRVATYSGLALGLVCALALVYVLINYFMGKNLEGWTSIAVLILLIGSIQLLMIGICGEYLGRMYIESKRRPLYVIDKVVSYRNRENG